MKGKNDSKYGLSMNLHLIHFFGDKQPQRPLGHLSTFIISVVGNTQFLPSTGTRELENEQRMSLTCIYPPCLPSVDSISVLRIHTPSRPVPITAEIAHIKLSQGSGAAPLLALS